jgi:hypothetical protein
VSAAPLHEEQQPPSRWWRVLEAAGGVLLAVTGVLALATYAAPLVGAAIGAALAAAVRVLRTKALKRDVTSLAVICLGGVVGATVVATYKLFHPPAKGLVTMQQILTEARHHGLELARDTRNPVSAHLRAGGPLNKIYVFRPINQQERRSDVLQLYEVAGDHKLHSVLSFRPDSPQPHADQITSSNLSNPPKRTAPAQLLIALHSPLRNLDGAGGDDLIFELREPVFGLPEWPVVMILRYNARLNQYQIMPLLSTSSIRNQRPADLIVHRHLITGDAARYLISFVYERPLLLNNGTDDKRIPSGYAVEAFACRRTKFVAARSPTLGVLLTAGYVIHEPVPNVPKLLQIVRWRVDLSGDTVRAYPETGASDTHRIGLNASGVTRVVRKAAGSGPRCYG